MGLERQTVLVVDDVPENINVLNEILQKEYRVKAAINGQKALEICAAPHPPDIILLDIMMPEIDGYEVCRRLKENPKTKKIPVIFISALSDAVDEEQGFELGAVDYIKKPVSPTIVRHRVNTQLELFDQNRKLEAMVKKRTKELQETRLAIVQRLGRAAEFKDNETGMHVIRIGNYCRLIALADGVPEDEAELLMNAAPMHDIGKIGIPDAVLLKPGRLDPDEFTIMKKHPEIGAEIIGEHNSDIIKAAHTCALYHHEKYDGSGYPFGLKGEEIPYYARITALADVFDALISERPYKEAWDVEKAVALIKEQSGAHFDANLAEKFVEIVPEILKIKEQYPDE